MNNCSIFRLSLLIVATMALPSCNQLRIERKNPDSNLAQSKTITPTKSGPMANMLEPRKGSLDFKVKNVTGQDVYICCFSYMQRIRNQFWKWEKSPIYHLRSDEECVVEIDGVDDKASLSNTFGYLGVVNSQHEADECIYETLPDSKKIDLDLLMHVHTRTVNLRISNYGIMHERLRYHVEPSTQTYQPYAPRFRVLNKTGKPVIVIPFIYEQPQDQSEMEVWQFSKSKPQRIEPDQEILVEIDEVDNKYDFDYLRGHLGVLEADEMELANQTTYELLKPNQKLSLGLISKLQKYRVVLNVEDYGLAGEKLGFRIKK